MLVALVAEWRGAACPNLACQIGHGDGCLTSGNANLHIYPVALPLEPPSSAFFAFSPIPNTLG